VLQEAIAAILEGAPLALTFNPLASLVAATLAAALYGGKRWAPRSRAVWFAVVLAAGWLAGDGLAVVAQVQDAIAASAASTVPLFAEWAHLLTLAIWGVGSLALGYLAPAAAGVFVGRRVIHGTGWASAGWIAGSASITLSMLTAVG